MRQKKIQRKYKRIQRYIWIVTLVVGGTLGFARFGYAQSWNPGGAGATCAPTLPAYPGCTLAPVAWAGAVTNTNTTTLSSGTWSAAKQLNTGNTKYVLQGDAIADGDGIIVNVNYVIIDLNGYTLTYNQTTSGAGISPGGWNLGHVAVINGSIIQGSASSGTTDPYGVGPNPISRGSYGMADVWVSNTYLEYSGNNVGGITASASHVIETVLNDAQMYGTILDRHSGVNAINESGGASIHHNTITGAKHRGIYAGSNTTIYENKIELRGLNTNGYGIFIYGGSNIQIYSNTISGVGSHPIGVGIINSGTNSVDVYANKITLAKTLYAEEELNCSAGIRAGSYGSPPGEVLTDIRIWNNEINLATQQDYSGQNASDGTPRTFDQCGKGLFIGGGVGSDVTAANNLVTMTHTGACQSNDTLSSAIAPFGMFSDQIFFIKNTIKGRCSNVTLADDYTSSEGGYPLFAGNNFVRLESDPNYATVRVGLNGYFNATGRFVDNNYTGATEYSHDLQMGGSGSTDVYWGHIDSGTWQYDHRCTGTSCSAITPTTLAYAAPADYTTWGDPPTGSGGTPDTTAPAAPSGLGAQ
jgi:hypothetical protein